MKTEEIIIETCTNCGCFIFTADATTCVKCGTTRMKNELSKWQQKAIERPELSDIDKGHLQIAIQMMVNIIYDNGIVNRMNPEHTRTYPIKHIREIARTAGIFFDIHHELLNDENISEICCGEYGENQEKFGIHPEYDAMSDALNKFFES